MHRIAYILFTCLLLGACSAEQEVAMTLPQENDQLDFQTSVGNGSVVVYEQNYFNPGDEIRICCPEAHATPNFEDGADGMYIYTYKETILQPENPDWSDWPYKFQPSASGGFSWRTLQPTSIYYVFEARHFPGKSYLRTVPVGQDKEEEFKNADMLIAHHRQILEKRGQAVQLTFHHAFAMVEITVKLPVSETAAAGPYPENALREVYMRSMLTGYTVNYSETIDNDALRTVRGAAAEGVGDEGREDIRMYRVPIDEKEEFETGTDDNGVPVKYQKYIFRGIVPEQDFLESGKEFLYFKVHQHGQSEEETTLYRLEPADKNLTLLSSHILAFRLDIKENEFDVAMIQAELLPWGRAEADMEIGPKSEP